MANDSHLTEWISRAKDFLNEQSWFQELKTKWEELDPNSRQYLKVGSLAGAALLVLILIFSSIWSVHSLKNELAEKQDLLTMVQTGNEELRRLRESNAGLSTAAAAGAGPWPAYFETVGTNSGIEKTSLSVTGDKPGTSTDTSKETLFEISVKHATIKQIVRYAFGLESGSRPVKLRNLQIDTKGDPTGYMDATLAVSGFALVTK